MVKQPVRLPVAAPEVSEADVMDDSFDVAIDAAAIVGLLETCRSRAGEAYANVGAALMRGFSRTMAATAAGIPARTLGDRCLRDPELAEALQVCEEMGFSRIESELYRRAFAGKDDRGSIRALEIVAKSRGPQFREKFQVHHEHTLNAERATAQAMAVLASPEDIDDEYESN